MLWAKRFCVVVIVCYIFLKQWPVDQRIHIKTVVMFLFYQQHTQWDIQRTNLMLVSHYQQMHNKLYRWVRNEEEICTHF